jgi:hypothetical protein
MANRKHAHNELFTRPSDEIFESFDELHGFCRDQRERSRDIWKVPRELFFTSATDTLSVGRESDGSFLMAARHGRTGLAVEVAAAGRLEAGRAR